MLAQIPQAHGEVVTSLSFSPHSSTVDGVLCSTSGDDTAALWDLHNGGANIARLQGHHRGPVNDAAFLPGDAHALLTASDDRTVALWDLRQTAAPVAQLTGFHDGVNKMLVLPASSFPNCGLPASGSGSGQDALIASACDDGRVYVHALVPMVSTNSNAGSTGAGPMTLAPAGQLVDSFWASTSTVNDIIASPDPRVVITASEDGALRSWRLLFDPNAATEDRLCSSLDEFDNPVNHVALVPQGLILEEEEEEEAEAAGATAIPTAANDDNGSGAAAGALEDGAAGIAVETGYGNSNNGGTNADEDRRTAQQRRRQRVEEERSGLRRWVLAACSELVFGVDYCVADGHFGDGARSFIGHSDYVRGLTFTRWGTLLTVSDDSTAVEWAVATGEPQRQVKLHDGMVMASALGHSGAVFATGTDQGEVRVWRLPFETERLSRQAS